MATRRDVDRLTGALDGSVSLALADLQEWFFSVDIRRPEYVRDELLEALPRLVDRYGQVAATAAAEWYEELRSGAVGGNYTASLADTFDSAEVERKARWAAGALWEDNPESLIQMLAGPIGSLIRDGGRATIEHNALRDRGKPRWARVPSRAGCCAWCRILASRGFVYHTRDKASLHDGHGYHDHCSCQPVPEWGGQKSSIADYDPDALYVDYMAARRKALAAGVTPTDGNVAYFMRRLAPSTVTDGVSE